MTTQISSKVAALAVALLMNSAILGGVAYLFSTGQARAHAALSVAANAVSESTRVA